MKIAATKSRFGRKNSLDFDNEKLQDGFEDFNTHSMIDTAVSTSTSLQSYGGAAYEEQRREHRAATRIQTAYRGFLVSISPLFSCSFFPCTQCWGLLHTYQRRKRIF